MLRHQRVYELRDHGVVVADDAGKECLARPQLANQVLAHLLMNVAARDLSVSTARRNSPTVATFELDISWILSTPNAQHPTLNAPTSRTMWDMGLGNRALI